VHKEGRHHDLHLNAIERPDVELEPRLQHPAERDERNDRQRDFGQNVEEEAHVIRSKAVSRDWPGRAPCLYLSRGRRHQDGCAAGQPVMEREAGVRSGAGDHDGRRQRSE
jgi:hypothetical protein